MSEEDELKQIRAAATVAQALREGDFEAFADLTDVLRAVGKPKIADFVLAIIWELLPDEAHDAMIATGEAEGRSNVIDFFTRKPRIQ
jgi:hypothetical protein